MRSIAILALLTGTPAVAQDLWFSPNDPSDELRSNPDLPGDAKLPIRAELPREPSSLKLDVPLSVEPEPKPASPNGSVSGGSSHRRPRPHPLASGSRQGSASRFRTSPPSRSPPP